MKSEYLFTPIETIKLHCAIRLKKFPIIADTQEFVDETQHNSRISSSQILKKEYNKRENYRKGLMRPQNTVINDTVEEIEMSVNCGSRIRSKETTYPHVLKDFLQDFSTYDKQFEINNEFNQLNLLDDVHHVKTFLRCNFQEPDMDRYNVLVCITL